MRTTRQNSLSCSQFFTAPTIFSRVEVQGRTGRATDFRVPVDIKLTAPEHLNKYSLGLGYATDTGIKGKVGLVQQAF